MGIDNTTRRMQEDPAEGLLPVEPGHLHDIPAGRVEIHDKFGGRSTMTDVDDWREPEDDREPDPERWLEEEAMARHELAEHDGRPCDCPPFDGLRPRSLRLMPGDPKIVVLCGSTRFYDEFRRANLMLTLAGQIVLSIGCDTKSDADLAAAGEFVTDPAAVKARLDELHKRKIDLADEVLVVSDESGYFGQSTAGEIAYANAVAKPVRYVHQAAEDRARSKGLIVEAPF
jgi:hypothetical protein